MRRLLGHSVSERGLRTVPRACLAIAPLVCACSSYDVEGMALMSPVESIVVGDTVSMSVVAHDGSIPSPPSVAWASSDSAIATVDELGVVTGIGPGWVLIEARTGDYALKLAFLVWATAGPFVSLDTGDDHNCAVDEDGRTWCWGSNYYAQLGTGFPPDRCFFTSDDFFLCAKAAIPVVTDVRFAELAAGVYHSCGISIAGTAHCWGLNDGGQLGDGGTETRRTPTPVTGAHVFKSLTAGGRTTCGTTVEDALLCWGSGFFHVDGTFTDVLMTPTRVAAEHQFAFAVTSGTHTCGVTPAGATYCWGSNTRGQLGVAGVDSICGSFPCTPEPQQVTSAPAFVDLALGRDFSCGLTAGGVAHCWGGNERGQLGDGTRTDRWEAMPVAGGHQFTTLEAAQDRACGLDAAGLLYCWGRDPSAFGNGGDPVEVDQPVPGAAGLAFTTISIGLDTQCGVDGSGVTWCWGANNDGALGNGQTQRFGLVTSPVRVVRHFAR